MAWDGRMAHKLLSAAFAGGGVSHAVLWLAMLASTGAFWMPMCVGAPYCAAPFSFHHMVTLRPRVLPSLLAHRCRAANLVTVSAHTWLRACSASFRILSTSCSTS